MALREGKLIILLLKSRGKDLLIIEVYVKDIIFRETSNSFSKEFAAPMWSEFEISIMQELSFFLGLQIKQTPKSSYVCQ